VFLYAARRGRRFAPYHTGMIVYCCPDLIFATRIRATAEAEGVPSRPARDAQALRKRLDQVDDGKRNEPVTGVIVDLDLGADAIAMIEQVKQHDAALPVVAYGSHVAFEILQQAKDGGADFVMPRSQFTATLGDIVKRLATSE